MIPVADRAAVSAVLRAARARLEMAGLATARQDAEWLLAAVLGVGRLALHVDPPAVPAAAAARLEALVARRTAHEPLQHLLGFEDFCGLRFRVTPDVLIPRPETEGLVRWAIEALASLRGSGGGSPRVVDVGTGSGAIACAVAAGVPGARVLGIDVSPAALAVAAGNVAALGLGARVALAAGDLLAPLRRVATVDAVVANLPYIPSGAVAGLPREVVAFEPRRALDGGADGLAFVARLVAEAPGVLRPDGWLFLEVGDGQAAAVAGRLAAAGFVDVAVRRDLGGTERLVAGRRA